MMRTASSMRSVVHRAATAATAAPLATTRAATAAARPSFARRFSAAAAGEATSTPSAATASSTSPPSTAGAAAPRPPRSWLRRLGIVVCTLVGVEVALSAWDALTHQAPPAPEKHIKARRQATVEATSVETSAPVATAAVAIAAPPAAPSADTTSPAAPALTAEEVEPSPSHPDHASCRACREGGEEADINNFYRKQAALGAAAAADSTEAVAALDTTDASVSPTPAPAASCPPCYAYSHSLCPLNRAEVGRAAWGYLHTMVAYYPDRPSSKQQAEMAQFLNLFMKLYPCGYCADRSMEQLEREPIEKYVSSQAALSAWTCRAHNEVNERLGKPIFDCQYTNQRWRDGPPTGECD